MIKACVFDAYGTLFDVAAAAREAAAEPGQEALAACWQALAATWRDKQLSYTWLRSMMGEYADFAQVTGEALDYALAAHKLADPMLRERLMALYFELSAYAEVPAVLRDLKAAGLTTAILSNGNMPMLEAAIRSAGLEGLLDAVISADELGIYKPDSSVYALVEKHLGTKPSEVLFTSSNGWDVAGATGFGFNTAWVNRAGLPLDRLPFRPAHELTDLAAIPGLAGRL